LKKRWKRKTKPVGFRLPGVAYAAPGALLSAVIVVGCGGEPNLAPPPGFESERPPDDLSAEAVAILGAHTASGCPGGDRGLTPPEAAIRASCAERARADWTVHELPTEDPRQARFTTASYGSDDCQNQAVTEIAGGALRLASHYAWALPLALTPAECEVAFSISTWWIHRDGAWHRRGTYGLAGAMDTIDSSIGRPCRLVPLDGAPSLQDTDVADGPRTFSDLHLAVEDSVERMRIATTLVVGCDTQPLSLFLSPASPPFKTGDNAL
jgi:hypothetical protein